MSIAFSCPDCGKTFKVPDELAGRKAKCSGCGVTILISQAVGLTEKPTARTRSKAAPVDEEDDWEGIQETPRKRRSSRRTVVDDVDDDYADEEPDPKSRKKRKAPKKKSRAMILALLAFLVLGLCGASGLGGFAIWWFWPSSSDLLDYAPNNCRMVIVFNLDKIEASKAYESISKESKNFDKTFNQEFASNAFKKAGVSQVMVAGSGNISITAGGGTNDDTIVAVKTKDKITADDIKNDASAKGPFKESSVGKYTLYEGATDAFCVIDGKKVIFGKAATLRAVLQRDKKPDFSDNMKAAMKKADLSKDIAVAVDSSGSVSNSPFAKDLASLELEWAALQVDLGTDIALTLTVQSRSEKGANEIKKKFDDLLNMLKSFQAIAPGAGDLWAVSPQTAVSGSSFTATATLKAEAIAKASKNQQQNFDFFNQPPKPPGGNPPGGNPPGGNPPPKKK
jgi:hypothetical protein